jgi:two-component system chemotaxis response regulator CheB
LEAISTKENMLRKIRVLVVDDSAFMRKAVAEILESDPAIEVAGTAKNGLEGLDMVAKLHPDVIVLDIDMPVMDGLTCVRHMMIRSPAPIVVLSSLFADGAVTFDALRLGVVDFVPKPSGAISQNIDSAKKNLIARVKLAQTVNMKNLRRVRLSTGPGGDQLVDAYRFRALDYLLAIGTTLSGPNTVVRLLSSLSPAIPASAVVVQEISPKIIDAFAEQFDRYAPWKVVAAENNMPIEQGTCYMSSTERRLAVKIDADGAPRIVFSNTDTRPLDLLFSSAANVFRQNTIGVLLTGIGNDGARGLAAIKHSSGVTVAQEAQTCVYPNLTDNAIRSGVVDIVLNESKLSTAIQSIMK